VKCDVCGAKTDAFLCPDCGHALAKTLGDLPSLLDALADRAAGRTRVYRASRLIPWADEELATLEAEHAATQALIPASLRERAGRITLPGTALPVDLDATKLLDQARNTLTTWARHLGDNRGNPIQAKVTRRLGVERNRAIWIKYRWPITVIDVCRWLHVHVDAIRYDEAAREIYTDLSTLHGKISRAVDRSPDDIYAGPCAHCQVDMWRRAGKDEIICDARYYVLGDAGQLETVRGCGMNYTLEQRTRWLLDAIRDELAPLDMLQGFVHSLGWPWPPAATVRAWRFRRRLDVRSVDRHGVELFRGGDVLDMLAEWVESRGDTRTGGAEVARRAV
jgi:hypothetical protein